MITHIRPLLALTLFALASGTAYSAATRIAFVDPFATARGNAFSATADNPSAVFYNAAGLTQVEGTQVQGNVFAISLAYEYDSALGSEDMDDDFQPVPSAFISHNFKDSPFAVGFGMYAPFALGSDWGSDAAFTAPFPSSPLAPGALQQAGLASVPYKADLAYIKYHFTAAWEITDTLSVAAGLSLDDTEVDLKANAIEYEGDDTVYGYSFSLLWQPNEKHSFGLNYQGKTEVEYEGTADTFTTIIQNQLPVFVPVSLDAEADLIFPESIIFGYSYRPNDQWNIEFNLDWTNWDRVNELTLDGVPGATYELNWESAFIWELGVTRYFDNGLHLSGGYTFVENAVPDADFLPIVPDSDRHFFAIGLGGSWEQLTWQITYQQAFASDRSVSGQETYPTIDGDYDLDSQAVALSLNWRF